MIVRRMLFAALVLGVLPSMARADLIVVDFEDQGLAAGSYDNGSSGAGGITSRGVFFRNDYDPTYQAWNGFAVSTMTDTTDGSFTNQYSAFPGSGAGGSLTYAVGYGFFPNVFDPDYFETYVNLPDATDLVSIDIANTTYTALTIRDGDPYGFSKRFGGASGSDPDLFRLSIIGFGETFHGDGTNSGPIVGTVDVDLADYRSTDNALDFVLDRWKSVDLGGLAGARSLGFRLVTTDNGDYGPNTPTYFALDNLKLRTRGAIVPEPGAGVLALTGIASFGGLIWRRRVRGRA